MPSRAEDQAARINGRQCLTPQCTRQSVRRGLCNACRVAASRMVEKGKVTETELIELNLLAEPRQGRKPSSLFATALQERRNNVKKRPNRKRSSHAKRSRK